MFLFTTDGVQTLSEGVVRVYVFPSARQQEAATFTPTDVQ